MATLSIPDYEVLVARASLVIVASLSMLAGS
jgi:hypothetical protein